MPRANLLIEKIRSSLTDERNAPKDETFLPTRIVGDIAGFIEDLNRLSSYIAFGKHDNAAAAAAEAVKRIQYNQCNANFGEQSGAAEIKAATRHHGLNGSKDTLTLIMQSIKNKFDAEADRKYREYTHCYWRMPHANARRSSIPILR